jgi:hypothetical protein
MERRDLIKSIEELRPNELAEVGQIVESLRLRAHRGDRALYDALSRYAVEHAGSQADLDIDLERASVEHLLQEPSFHRLPRRRRTRRLFFRQRNTYGFSERARRKGYARH